MNKEMEIMNKAVIIRNYYNSNQKKWFITDIKLNVKTKIIMVDIMSPNGMTRHIIGFHQWFFCPMYKTLFTFWSNCQKDILLDDMFNDSDCKEDIEIIDYLIEQIK